MTNRFDCVAMKRKGSLRISQQLAGLTRQEQLAFWQAGAAPSARTTTTGSAKGSGCLSKCSPLDYSNQCPMRKFLARRPFFDRLSLRKS